jgi:hypothetical protein
VYDVELPLGFVPIPLDGEVESFQCLDMDTILSLVLGQNFKPEAMVVMVDFFMRHGLLNPDTEPEYDQLSMLLKASLPFHGPIF